MRREILVVDDESLVRDSLESLLTQEGYDVTAASSGGEAIDRLSRNHFDVALVDLRLPDMSGIDILKAAREKNNGIDVFMMTGFATAETAVQAMKMGALEYLMKPLNDDEIRISLRRVFETKQLKQELEAGTKIIVSTLQKFPYIEEEIKALPGKSFAIIIDEAHSSSSGEMSKSLKKVLNLNTDSTASRDTASDLATSNRDVT